MNDDVSDALLVFLKQPLPGSVKTRLIPALGAETAAALYRAMAEELMRRTRSTRYRRLACYAPEGAREAMDAWLPGEDWHAQRGGDLGERMRGAFAAAFAGGARRVAIVGSDLPWLGEAEVRQALEALARAEVVLGPSRDGGYYLMALGAPRPGLFDDIAWSTGSVLEATLERAAREGLRVAALEERDDIDTLEDVRADWTRLRRLLAGSPALARIEAALAA